VGGKEGGREGVHSSAAIAYENGTVVDVLLCDCVKRMLLRGV